MPGQYDNRGKAASWPSKGPGQPRRIVCHAHRDIKEGEEFEVALWGNDSNNPKAPDFTGKVQDKFVPRGDHSNARTPRHETPSEDFNDEIPF